MARQALWPSLALVAVLGGCRDRDGPPDPPVTVSTPLRTDVTVTEITLGRALQPNRRVAPPLDTFAAGDTVYASVVTEGSARHGVLKARWTYQDAKVVSESSLAIAPSGTTASEFHISQPEGLPAGRYEVEIFLDGASAGKRSFSVQ